MFFKMWKLKMQIVKWLVFGVILFGMRLVVADSEFSVDDILNVNFMPGSLMMLDLSSENPLYANTSSASSGNKTSSDPLNEGSFNDAFMTMGFHRKMMNEYLCRTFLADQILEEMTPVKLNRRIGNASPRMTKKLPKNNTVQRRKGRVETSTVQDSLLSDPGSSNYKDWLTKTTTLEDIYKHYGVDNRVDQSDNIDVDEPREDFDGDVTGFAVQGGVGIPGILPIATPPMGNPAKIGGHSGYAYNGGYHSGPAYAEPNHVVAPGHYGGSAHGVQYQQHQPQHYDFPPQFVHYHHKTEGGHGKKDMILKDLFDIALTALAFLSFGVFAIQVILCIATTTTTTTVAALSLMSASGISASGLDDSASGTASGGDHSGPGYGGHTGSSHFSTYHRQRRDAETVDNSVMNELARRVLASMEAVFIADQDDGNCLRREICANNRYSRTVQNNQQIWIPVYGLALSWLSGRLSTSLSSAGAMLESLKAAALGLGKADCDVIYPKCNLPKERDVRRKRRRKRSTN